jgi:acetylornithine deacetylase
MITAAERLRARGENGIGLLFLVGEENGSDGARAAADLGPRGRFLINGEPTENQLSVGQKGSLRVNLHATGRWAHSGYPDEGASATEALLDTLERIRQLPLASDPLLGHSTLNIGVLQGGVAPNVIPGEASAQLLFRIVEPTAELRRAVEAAAAPGVEVTFGLELPYHKSEQVPDGWPTTVVSYGSDLPFLGSWGECYQLGPGTIRVAHSDGEHIRKDDLLRGIDLYVRLASDLLARGAT